MGIGSIIGALVIGLILGVLGRLFAPGKQSIPIWLTIIVGIAAAFVGTWIARLLGVEDTPGIDWIELIVQIVVAAIGVSVVAGMYGRKSVS
ncbi:GlsB/YeaQ/YmgE family stress response membrane protein [Lentzea cavernae]|uniref:Transglycosylase n=1 Tax=Lentzea cavernae TaxID=2020703 RepID=A0ABQ3N5A0_9PSEU|nr:GlsB/YeaQ/YmgE family stress response membrane protein [Lentzea cavernae]GHH63485.1 transglycosylase [Lentzea cavernae]